MRRIVVFSGCEVPSFMENVPMSTVHPPSLLYIPLIISAPSPPLPLLSCLFLFSYPSLLPFPSPSTQQYSIPYLLFSSRTGMGLPEPGLSPVHRVFWGPQDARVTHHSRSISCIGRVDTRADSVMVSIGFQCNHFLPIPSSPHSTSPGGIMCCRSQLDLLHFPYALGHLVVERGGVRWGIDEVSLPKKSSKSLFNSSSLGY